MAALKKIKLLFLFTNAVLICCSQVNLNQGLMAYYPFTGNANDISGNNNNPVFNNASLTADRLGTANSAYHFNGSSSYMQVPNSASLNFSGTTMSIAVWVKPTGYYTGLCYNNILLTKSTVDNGAANYSLRFSDAVNGCGGGASTTQEMFYGEGGALATTPLVQLNKWYSVIWTCDGTTTKIYVDCILRASGPAAGLNFANANDLFFGHMNNATYPYWLNADLDEVRIYNRALNTDEVNALGGCAVTSACVPSFQKLYSGSKDDNTYSVIANADGTYVTGGYTNSFGNGGYDGQIQKLDKSGNLLWSKTYGGTGNDLFYRLKPTIDGGYIGVGSTTSFGGSSTGVAWLVKTDGNGNMQWSRKYDDGNANGSNGWNVVSTSDGGYALSGVNRYAPGLADAMVIKTDNTGAVVWAKSFESGSSDQSLGIIEDADSLVVIANQYGQGSSLYNGVLMKLNRNNGNIIWSRNFDIEGKSNWPTGLVKTLSGYGILFYNDISFSLSNPETVVANTDRNGTPLSLRKITNSVTPRETTGYTATTDGGFIITEREANNPNGDMHLVKVNSAGVVQWTNKYAGTGLQTASGIAEAPDGGFILSGFNNVNNAFNDSNNVYVLKTDNLGNTPGCNSLSTTATVSSPAYTVNASFTWSVINNLSFGSTSITPVSLNATPTTTTFCVSCISSVTDTIINAYAAVVSFDTCKNTVTIDDAAKYKVGDTVLMIQMKGAIIDSTNTATFGNISNYRNAGNYEFNYIKSKNGNLLELKNTLTRQYNIADGKIQLVRVPFFQKLSLPNILTCQPWNGSTGGILVFNVADTLNLNADIDVSGKGFRGTPIADQLSSCHEAQYFYNATSPNAGFKGEGIFNLSANYAKGRGKAANAGGGGNGVNAGGGGGANFGSGGIGGREFLCGTPQIDNGGIGGLALNYSTTANKIFMGGAGGSGDENDNTGSAGGNGGGIVLINAGGIKSNGYRVSSKGITPAACAGPNCGDGQGGGGAGGTVILNVTNFVDNITVNTTGGDGGSYNNTNPLGYHGPGGGGGGGALWLKAASLPASVTHISAAGANGTWISTGQFGGAAGGSAGGTLFNVAVPVANAAYKATFDSAKFNVIVTTCTSFKFDGLANIDNSKVVKWRWSFGDGYIDSTQAVSHNYLAPGTYPVKVIATDVYGCVFTLNVDLTVFCRCEAIRVITPNPAINTVSISGLGCGTNTIVMFNMLGQKVRQVVSDKPVETIDVRTLARGMYIIKVINSKGIATPLKIEKM